MKKLSFFFAGLLFLFASLQVYAQSKTGADYFAGKWSVLFKNLPQGDTKMLFVLNKTDSVLTGVAQDSTGTEVAKLSKVDLTDSSATLYFTAQGYDVNVVMNKKDEDHVTGNMLGMFNAEGERIKANKLNY